MKSLWAARREILERVRAAQEILVFLDYDGTLVPIQPTPELAELGVERKKLLSALASLPKFRVGLLTGRSLKDIQKAVGLSRLFYAANYGLKIVTPKKNWVHPEARRGAVLIKKMIPGLKRLSSEFRSVRGEDKTLTVAIHYRQYRGGVKPLRRSLQQLLKEYGGRFRLKPGKKIFEVYPAVDWDKGRALLKIQRLLGFRKRPLIIFFGDAHADEEAFRRMRKTDISVAVGRTKKTAARFFCKKSGDVVRFLELLLVAEASR